MLVIVSVRITEFQWSVWYSNRLTCNFMNYYSFFKFSFWFFWHFPCISFSLHLFISAHFAIFLLLYSYIDVTSCFSYKLLCEEFSVSCLRFKFLFISFALVVVKTKRNCYDNNCFRYLRTFIVNRQLWWI